MQREDNDPPPSPRQLQAKNWGAGGPFISIFVAFLERRCVVCTILTST